MVQIRRFLKREKDNKNQTELVSYLFNFQIGWESQFVGNPISRKDNKRTFLFNKENRSSLKEFCESIPSNRYFITESRGNNLLRLTILIKILSIKRRDVLYGSTNWTIKRLFQTLLWCTQQLRRLEIACSQFSNTFTSVTPYESANCFFTESFFNDW